MAAGDTVMTIVGNLVREPELKFGANGTAVCGLTIASTPRFMDRQTNEWKDGEALFLRCVVFGKHAENVAESVSKGMRVIVTGRLKANNYERDGVMQYGYKLECDEVAPSLKFATAKVNRADRQSSSGGAPANDPWATASPTRPAAGANAYAGGGGNVSDEPPF